MKQVIEVTQEDINQAQPGCYQCPIALAVRRTFGLTFGHAAVDGALILIGEFETQRYLMPEEARRFVRQFDDQREVTPFSFEIEVPDV